jgi:hypothetical protein
MASKTAAGLKRQLLGLYNDLAETVKSKEASLCEIVGSEERHEAERVLGKMKKKLKKAEEAAFDDSDSE